MGIPKSERCLARATLYRYLSLTFAYPVAPVHAELLELSRALRVAAPLVSPEIEAKARDLEAALQARERAALASEYRALFTHSASPDCPLNESAYGARHIFQEVHELADISGFYNAFGVEIKGDRPDSLAGELEFCYLLLLKEANARDKGQAENARTCEDARRKFLHDHLGRWAENIGRRMQMLAPESAYAPAGALLVALAANEIAALRITDIVPLEEVPQPPEPPDDGGCPAEEGLGVTADVLMEAGPGIREPVLPGA